MGSTDPGGIHKEPRVLQRTVTNYHDKEVVEWLRYGWPTGRLPTLPQAGLAKKNHKGATEFPQALQRYLAKEMQYGAVMGPYRDIPFTGKV